LAAIAYRQAITERNAAIENAVLHAEKKIRRILLETPRRHDREALLRQNGFIPLKSLADELPVPRKILTDPPADFPTSIRRRLQDGRLTVYSNGQRIYLSFNGPNHRRLVAEELPPLPSTRHTLLEAGAVFLLFFLLYASIRRALKPLKRLAGQIERFGEGDFDISTRSEGKDEIALIANRFDEAIRKMRAMKEARHLFLRNIMHELKTPIAKGRLLSEMIDDPKKKQRFHAIFQRLNLLIDEFAKVEQISSKNFQPDFRPYKASDILEGSIDLLMLDDPGKYLHTVIREDFTLRADFELLTLALKNLIDNGIKYSPDHRVDLLVSRPRIVVSNRGKALPYPIEEYYTPFHASQGGLGLGLYIVKSILDLHGMELEYRYEEGQVSFTIFYRKPDHSEISTNDPSSQTLRRK
jgi:two-component system OmpR family sensor kinase